MPDYVTASTEEHFRQARALLREYEEYVGVDLSFQGFEEEFRDLEHEYGPPAGVLLLVREEGQTAGCIALRNLGNGICEMKRLFMKPQFRGRGLGRKCAEQIVQIARETGYVSIRLDTLPSMRAAIDLYGSMGFNEIAPYTNNPVEGAMFMELVLTPA